MELDRRREKADSPTKMPSQMVDEKEIRETSPEEVIPEDREREPLNDRELQEIPPGKKVKQYVATLAVCLGAFTAGNFLSWTSSALPMLKLANATDFPLEKAITDSQGMWIGSLLAIGALFTAFPVGFLADRFGRKKMLFFLAAPCIISWVIVIFGKKVEAIYGARLLAGFATGGICVVVPLYVGEIAEKSIRGALGSYFQLLLTVGILYSYVLGAFFNYLWLGVLCLIAPILFLILLCFIPETPYHYIAKGKTSLAEKAIKWFRGQKYNAEPQIKKIEEEVEDAKKNKATCKELVATKAQRKALFLGFGLMIFQQLCGINAVIFYTAQIFQFAGSKLDPYVCAIIVGSVQVGATGVSIFLVDRLGRKILLLISGAVMSFCLIIFGIYFHLKEISEESVKNYGWIPLFAVNLFIICYSLGYGPLPWMMLGELFSSSTKGLASGLTVTVNWLLVFVVTKTFSDLIYTFGTAGTFWFFGAITCAGICFVVIFVKETKGKSFAEIQKILSD